MKKLFFYFCMLSALSPAAQTLPRRPLFGVQMLRIDDDTKRVMKLKDTKGVLVKAIIPNSTAQKAGIKPGDIIYKLNGTEVNAPDEAVRLVTGCSGGQEFSYELLRNNELIKSTSTLEPMPVEAYDGIVMEYKEVKTVNGLQRLIVSRPEDKAKHPAIVFVGGIGCYSLDFPMDPMRAEVQLLNKLTKEGYVCIRAEKPGVGDNMKCTPCNEVSFMNETEGYISAVKEVKGWPSVDSSQIYILGHSMGGVMGPVIAKQERVKGIIAYGTIGSNFIEYLAKTRRTIAEAYDMKPEEADNYIKDFCECAAYYFVDGLSTAEAAAKKGGCQEYLSVFDLRSPQYNKELYALNIPGTWKGFNGKALLLWGESDYVASKEDHQIIANTVNYYHRGNATMMTVKGSAHGMSVARSFQEALSPAGASYNPEVGNKIISWLKSIG